MQLIKYPFGLATKIVLVFAAIIAQAIDNTYTHLTLAMTGNATLNLTPNAEMPVGSQLVIRASADGTNRTLTPGTGMTGLAVVLTANKSYNLTYEFDGATYVHVSTMQLN